MKHALIWGAAGGIGRALTQKLIDKDYTTAQASVPLLTSEAKLVFLGAIHERLRLPGLSAYAAAKAGLEAFAETLRKEGRTPQCGEHAFLVKSPLLDAKECP